MSVHRPQNSGNPERRAIEPVESCRFRRPSNHVNARRRDRESGPIMLLLCALAACCGCDRPDQASGAAASLRFPDPYPIEMTGRNFEWHIRYPGSDGQLGTRDDLYAVRNPHVPAEARLHITLKSHDYLYSFGLPQFNLKQIAVPDLEFDLELNASAPREIEFKGDQFCGFSHPNLSGMLVVQPADEFAMWLDTLPVSSEPAAEYQTSSAPTSGRQK